MSGRSEVASSGKQWLLIVLILFAFGRGIWALGDKSLWWDESLSLYRAERDLGFLLSNKIILSDTVNSVVTVDNHPPIYFLLLWLGVRVFGQSEFALRFMSLASVVLIVPLLYIAGKRLLGRRVGLAAAALGALSPMYLWYGQEARMYALVAFLSLLSFYTFIRAFFDPIESFSFRRQWKWIAAYVLASVCIVFTHYLAVLLIAFELIGLGALFLRRADRRRAFLSVIVAVLVVLLLSLSQILSTQADPGGAGGLRFLPVLDLLRDLLNSFSLGLSVDVGQWFVLLIDLGFLLFLILGFLWAAGPGATRDQRKAGLFLAGYLLAPIAFLYLVSYVQPAYLSSRHMIFVTPAFYLLLAAGLARWRGRIAGIAVLGWLLVIGGVGYSTYNYFYDARYDKDDHRAWGAYLRQQVRPGDVVVVDPPHIAELYGYYADSGVPWVGLPLLNSPTTDTVEQLEGLLLGYDRVWLAYSSTPIWGDRQRVPENWLNEQAFRIDYREFQGYGSAVIVACYLRSWPAVSALPDDAHPVDVRYDASLRLAGYRLASPAQPGKLFHVDLFWGIDDFIPEEASVQLRLSDAQGHLWAEGEQCPYNGLYPMWQWQPGLLLRDPHELEILPDTPPGTYQLEVALVSRPTEEGCPGGAGPRIAPMIASPQLLRGESVLLGNVEVGRADAPGDLGDLEIQYRHRARFEGLELLGASLAPASLKPGGRLNVSLYWRAHHASLPDAEFQLRMVDASGETWQEAIIRPVGSGYPTDRWLAGEQYRGQFWVQISDNAPPGRYWLELAPNPPLLQRGLLATLRRWLSGRDGSLRLGSVDVQAWTTRPFVAPATAIPLPIDHEISHPMIAILGDRVRFLGYDLVSDTVPAGEALEFTLYWQPLRPMSMSYSIFTHLLGPSDLILGQKDGIPRDGTYPTTSWQAGEVIVDTYTFVVDPSAPPGRHELEVGMYLLENGVRLPVVGEDGQPMPGDRILLSEITVLPPLPPTPVPQVRQYRVYVPLVMVAR